MNNQSSRTLLSALEIDRTIARLAHQIIEPADSQENLTLLGIRRGGEMLARRIASTIKRIQGKAPTLGFLNVNLYRDDHVAHEMPESLIPGDVRGRTIVLIDDVLFTGRTVRSALDAVMDLGRPAALRLCVLIDRGLRELPIQADFVGRVIPTSRRERVVVAIAGTPSTEDAVTLLDDAP